MLSIELRLEFGVRQIDKPLIKDQKVILSHDERNRHVDC